MFAVGGENHQIESTKTPNQKCIKQFSTDTTTAVCCCLLYTLLLPNLQSTIVKPILELGMRLRPHITILAHKKKNRKKTNRQKRGTEERQNLPSKHNRTGSTGSVYHTSAQTPFDARQRDRPANETKNTKQKQKDENGMYGITRVVFLAPPLPLCLQHAKTAMGNSSPTAAFPLPVRAWTMIENTQNCQYTRCTTISSYRYL